MIGEIVRAATAFAIGHAPDWLLDALASPVRLLAAEYAVRAILVAILLMVTRADARKHKKA